MRERTVRIGASEGLPWSYFRNATGGGWIESQPPGLVNVATVRARDVPGLLAALARITLERVSQVPDLPAERLPEVRFPGGLP